jgi:hypothetical protein
MTRDTERFGRLHEALDERPVPGPTQVEYTEVLREHLVPVEPQHRWRARAALLAVFAAGVAAVCIAVGIVFVW